MRMTIRNCARTSSIIIFSLLSSISVEMIMGESMSDRELLQQANFSDIWRVFPSNDDFLKGVKNPCWKRREIDPVDESSVAKIPGKWGRSGDTLCLPSFYILGPQKTGTTDLYKRIIKHPQVLPAKRKEIHWWTERFPRSYESAFAEYTPFFEKASENVEYCKNIEMGSENYDANCRTVTGEASATTMYLNRGWLRELYHEWPLPRIMAALQPNAKLIAFLREPGTRFLSEHKFFYHIKTSRAPAVTSSRCSSKMGLDEPPEPTPGYFHSATKLSIERFERCVRETSELKCIHDPAFAETGPQICPSGRIAVGLYALYLDPWLKYFPRENILLLRLEDFEKHPKAFIDSIFRFIGVKTTEYLNEDQNFKILHEGRANSQRSNTQPALWMLPETRALLTEFYNPYNQRLAALLNDSRFLWTEEIGIPIAK